MLKIGDTIKYSQSGVCRIDDIRKLDFGSNSQDYYILSPVYKQSSTVYVPCENKELVSKIIPIISRSEIDKVLFTAKKANTPWIKDFRKRSENSKLTLLSSDRVAQLLLIKSIYTHKKDLLSEGKRVHTTDDYILKDAELLLFGEFAFVLGKEPEDVAAYIKKELQLEA